MLYECTMAIYETICEELIVAMIIGYRKDSETSIGNMLIILCVCVFPATSLSTMTEL